MHPGQPGPHRRPDARASRPTDLAIIRLRRLILDGARGLLRGVEPPQAQASAAYAVRSGSAVARRGIPFEEVMTTRFADPAGRALQQT